MRLVSDTSDRPGQEEVMFLGFLGSYTFATKNCRTSRNPPPDRIFGPADMGEGGGGGGKRRFPFPKKDPFGPRQIRRQYFHQQRANLYRSLEPKPPSKTSQPLWSDSSSVLVPGVAFVQSQSNLKCVGLVDIPEAPS